MDKINKKLEKLLTEYDFWVQEGIIVSEEERDRALFLAKELQQYAKDLTTEKGMQEFIAAHKEDFTK
jgi:hypothetical protein